MDYPWNKADTENFTEDKADSPLRLIPYGVMILGVAVAAVLVIAG
jgi:hypothetical protein